MKFPPKSLAALALVLALLAMVARNPKGSDRLSMDVHELARIIQREEDHVTAEELASFLMNGTGNIRLIDLRDSTMYVSYHIPSAARLDIATLIRSPISKSDTVVLYSEGGIHAAQAWMLMAAQGYRNVFTLRGGLLEWNEKVLFPTVPSTASVEERKRIQERAMFFGGKILATEEKKTPQRLKKEPVQPKIEIQKKQEKTREIC
ncbi:MAG: rhodanese-like domain-containing protein [Ignavibacteriales bacterium]|nr:rhodanese-like domain-containing protein [Ignavibacteriales bacterium]